MRTRTKVLRIAALPLLIAGGVFLAATPAAASAGTAAGGSAATVAAEKAALDKGAVTPKVSASMQRLIDAKQKVANALYAASFGVRPATCDVARPGIVRPACGSPAPTSRALAANQVAQINGYYCGPATLVEAVGVRGVSLSQTSAASELGTTKAAGTAWTTGSKYPMATALNHYLGSQGAVFVAVSLPDSPTSTQISNYKAALVEDIVDGWGFAANAYEVVGGHHLVGHPNSNIMHWVEVRGYTSSGANTSYEDSVHGATSISWYSGVPAYSTISSTTFAEIIGGRGYVW